MTVFTKADLARVMTEKFYLSHRDAVAITNGVFDAIMEHLAADERVVIKGFGTFAPGFSAARKGFNPRTREAVEVPACRRVSFKSGAELKRRINAEKAED